MNWPLLLNSFLVAGATTVLAVGGGFLVAVCLAGVGPGWRGRLLLLPIMVLALPPFLLTNCWLDLLGTTGLLHPWVPVNIYSLPGTVLILAFWLWPIPGLAMLTGWERLEPSQLESEPLLRGGALFRWLLWPLARINLLFGASLVFVLALNHFTVPALLQVKVLPAAIWIGFSTNLDPGAAFATGWPLVVGPLLLFLWLARLSNPSWPRLEGGVPARLFRRQLGAGWFVPCSIGTGLLLGVSAVLPILQLAGKGRTWLELGPALAAGQSAVANSAFYAAAAATITLLLAGWQIVTPRAWSKNGPLVGRGSRRAAATVVARWLRTARQEPRPTEQGIFEQPLTTVRRSRDQSDTDFQVCRVAGSQTGEDCDPAASRQLGSRRHSRFGNLRYRESSPSERMPGEAAGAPASSPAFAEQSCLGGLGMTAATRTPKAGRRLALRAGALLWVPFLLPGVFLGIGLLWALNRPGLAWLSGGAGLVLAALVIRYLALAWFGVAVAWRGLDRDLLDAGQLDGLRGWGLLRHIVWPQAGPHLAAVWYGVYLLSLWDVETVVLLLPPGGDTLASRIFNLLHYGHSAQVNALCVWLLLLALAPLALREAGVAIHRQWTGGWARRWAGRKDIPAAAAALVLVAAVTACKPAGSSSQAPLKSRLFSRVEIIGSRGTGAGEFNKPRSLAVDAADNLYVADMTGRVQKFSPEGKYLLSWQMPETDLGKPKGMCRDREGQIVVIEPHYQRVNHFSTNGVLVAQWGGHLTNHGPFSLPRAVAVNSHNEVLVSEYTLAERVQVFAARGTKRLMEFGRPGMGPGEFNRAEGLAVDRADRVYVADSCNHRIQVFDADGKFLRTYGKAGRGLGELSYPYDVQVDGEGRQFVCEFGNSRVQIFDAHDQLLEILGGPGAAPGRFANPWSLALDSHGNLYVADSQNHRVQKFLRREASGKAGATRTGSGPDPYSTLLAEALPGLLPTSLSPSPRPSPSGRGGNRSRP